MHWSHEIAELLIVFIVMLSACIYILMHLFVLCRCACIVAIVCVCVWGGTLSLPLYCMWCMFERQCVCVCVSLYGHLSGCVLVAVWEWTTETDSKKKKAASCHWWHSVTLRTDNYLLWLIKIDEVYLNANRPTDNYQYLVSLKFDQAWRQWGGDCN